jgi:hypothetical protein
VEISFIFILIKIDWSTLVGDFKAWLKSLYCFVSEMKRNENDKMTFFCHLWPFLKVQCSVPHLEFWKILSSLEKWFSTFVVWVQFFALSEKNGPTYDILVLGPMLSTTDFLQRLTGPNSLMNKKFQIMGESTHTHIYI